MSDTQAYVKIGDTTYPIPKAVLEEFAAIRDEYAKLPTDEEAGDYNINERHGSPCIMWLNDKDQALIAARRSKSEPEEDSPVPYYLRCMIFTAIASYVVGARNAYKQLKGEDPVAVPDEEYMQQVVKEVALVSQEAISIGCRTELPIHKQDE